MRINKIFIIDDEPDIAALLCLYAGALAIETDTISSWSQVDMNLLKQADLLMLDLSMPDLDGLDILALLHRANLTVPIVLCSGQDDNVIDTAADLLKSYGLPYAGKLLKPFTEDDFAALLSRAAIQPSFHLPEHLHREPLGLDTISESLLLQGIQEDWFTLFYQPQFYAGQGTLSGIECLARLSIPGKRTIMPDLFIPALSAYGLMDDFTLKMLDLGLSTFEVLSIPADFKVSFNLAASSITEEFLARLVTCFRKHNLAPQNIVLEVTETATLHINQHTKTLLTKLRLKGFNLSLDDFGTGYGTIQEIDALPFNEIKIDKTFVQSMHDKNTSMAIVSSTIHLAEQLKFRVIAEGVETQQQLETLLAMNCKIIQGYLYSKPLSKNKLMALLSQHKITETGARQIIKTY